MSEEHIIRPAQNELEQNETENEIGNTESLKLHFNPCTPVSFNNYHSEQSFSPIPNYADRPTGQPMPKTRTGKGRALQRLTVASLLSITALLAFVLLSSVHSNTVGATTAANAANTSTTTFNTAALTTQSGGELTVKGVAQAVEPAVVQITNQQTVSSSSFGRGTTSTGSTTQDTGVGSGIIYDKAGYILTNNHVVEGADALLVTLPDGSSFSGKVVGTDPVTDLAVVKIDAGSTSLPVAALGDSATLQVGDGLVAIGNALALPGGPTVTAGVVSALDRSVAEPTSTSQTSQNSRSALTASATGQQLYGLIQTDAAINPGNSGGPLVNMEGQVVGINTLGAGQAEPGIQAEGIGFAISINQAKAIAQELVTSGKVTHAQLGISSQPLTAAIAKSENLSITQGTVVAGVQTGSAAAKAGLVQGDVIVSIDGEKLSGESSLGQIISADKPGQQVTLQVVSANAGSTTHSVQVMLGAMS